MCIRDRELRVQIWALYLAPLVYVSVFVPVPCCLGDHSFVVKLEIKQHNAPGFAFLFEHILSNLGFFLVPYKFWDCLFQHFEQCWWNFGPDGIESSMEPGWN